MQGSKRTIIHTSSKHQLEDKWINLSSKFSSWILTPTIVWRAFSKKEHVDGKGQRLSIQRTPRQHNAQLSSTRRPWTDKHGLRVLMGSRDSSLVTAPDSWSKGCVFESQKELRENFLLSSQLCVLALIRCPFHPLVTAVAHKRPQALCQKCKWQVTHTPLTKQSQSGLTTPLSRHSVETYKETSSHPIRQGTLSHLSSLSHCGLILA